MSIAYMNILKGKEEGLKKPRGNYALQLSNRGIERRHTNDFHGSMNSHNINVIRGINSEINTINSDISMRQEEEK
jgi:hypothetical protein